MTTEPETQCDGRHPLVRPDGTQTYLYDLVIHDGCPHQPWARTEVEVVAEAADDVTRVDCPAGCPYRDRDHWHIEYPDGYGEVIGHDGSLIEPWDLHRGARCSYPTPSSHWGYARSVQPGSCYRTSSGLAVHVRPGCHC